MTNTGFVGDTPRTFGEVRDVMQGGAFTQRGVNRPASSPSRIGVKDGSKSERGLRSQSRAEGLYRRPASTRPGTAATACTSTRPSTGRPDTHISLHFDMDSRAGTSRPSTAADVRVLQRPASSPGARHGGSLSARDSQRKKFSYGTTFRTRYAERQQHGGLEEDMVGKYLPNGVEIKDNRWYKVRHAGCFHLGATCPSRKNIVYAKTHIASEHHAAEVVQAKMDIETELERQRKVLLLNSRDRALEGIDLRKLQRLHLQRLSGQLEKTPRSGNDIRYPRTPRVSTKAYDNREQARTMKELDHIEHLQKKKAVPSLEKLGCHRFELRMVNDHRLDNEETPL